MVFRSSPEVDFDIIVFTVYGFKDDNLGKGILKPKIFIASSGEGEKIANAVQAALHGHARAYVWKQAFPLSRNTIDALLKNFVESDYAIFVFSTDDKLELRDKSFDVARDNVLFEAGLSWVCTAKSADS